MRGVLRLPVENFLSHSTGTFRRGTFLCLRKLLVAEYFIDKKGKGKQDGVSRFSNANILCHSTENLRGGNLLCFKKYVDSKNNKDKRGTYYDYPSKFFCLTIPNNSVEEPFCISECCEYRKILFMKKAYYYFLSDFFCLTVAKKFVDDTFGVSETSRIGKFYA